ncbi:cysteine--tRNA ligase [Mesorhizobium sp. B2-4-18]|uniref:cysteine--tRNA ligase n=1 Tax=Mesorhizobium sp. B2-4-18 TaxID=2589931 RepID=UPI0011266987|nr:cysteine--tRNA ligase [Mesorhizobium sp. B2-4-18]TPK75056.1 cysteine--tRNA ligase [Mesorhizobium sp. B2-4-18]
MSDASKGLRLYNTLTRTKEGFVPIDPLAVRMYVCGPTVYDFAHIGNARPVIVFDVLFRLLRHLYGETHVTYVRNITDVDDKINARALRDFGGEIASGTLSLNEAIRRVTEKTADQFHRDVATLGCLEPTVEPRATEFVEPRADGKADMITLIKSLIERGHAYVAAGEVLFDTASMPDYGQLSKRNLDEQQAGARIAVEAHKRNPGDFVLWKLSSPEEPGWQSPWGRGRPGWHIECSAMSAAYLGEVFDIHGGGLDLIFPHHENEIAQSRCAHGTDVMANVWMHNGFLQVEGQKMSKSLGNFYSIHELLETETFGGRRWPGEVLRLAMLMTHYREPIDFSVRKLEEAENTLRKWKRASDLAPAAGSQVPAEVVEALSDDLATYAAFQQLTQLAGEATDFSGAGENGAAASLKTSLAFLGFDVGAAKVDEAAIAETIARRLQFIAAKNWAEADRIRDELLAKGVQLKDGKDPVTGERLTTWEVKR